MRPKSISTHTEPDDEPQYDGPSKSQRKRESHALQDIGAQQVALSANQLKRIEMPDNLRLASEETQAEATDLAWLEVDCVRVKGRAAPTRLFALVGDDAMARSAAFNALRARHSAMLESYRACRFAEAAGLANRLADENADLAMLYRAFAVLAGEAAAAPAGAWSAVRILDSK